MTNKELKKKIEQYYKGGSMYILTGGELMDLIKEVVESVIPENRKTAMEEEKLTKFLNFGFNTAVLEMKNNLYKLLKEENDKSR